MPSTLGYFALYSHCEKPALGERTMKKVLLCAALLCVLCLASASAFANAYVNFAGITGFTSLSSPFTLTSCFGPSNCSTNPVFAPWSVTFAAVNGNGGCQSLHGVGVCMGTAWGATESFSVPVNAYALF